jgi:hypothetical protein
MSGLRVQARASERVHGEAGTVPGTDRDNERTKGPQMILALSFLTGFIIGATIVAFALAVFEYDTRR